MPLDALPPSRAAPLIQLRASNPTLEAVLIPNVAGLSVKIVARETTDLLQRLTSAARIPVGDEAAATRTGVREIARLVLDRVLEVETRSGFVSGAAAVPTVFAELPEPTGHSRTSTLSVAALRYAERLELDDPALLADRIYRFNRRPASPQWRRMFPTERSVADRLGLDGELGSPELSAAAGPSLVVKHTDYWLQWLSTVPSTRSGRTVYKLYISPDLTGLREAFNAALRLFREKEPPLGLKVGRALSGVLRPDKLVVYFTNRQLLDRGTGYLNEQLAGLAAQPVPFTVDCAGEGLLSWGVDPPRQWQLPGWRHGDSSWRAWLTTRLAAAVLSAREGEQHELAPWRFALARAAVDGIDPQTWTPDPAVWEAPAGNL